MAFGSLGDVREIIGNRLGMEIGLNNLDGAGSVPSSQLPVGSLSRVLVRLGHPDIAGPFKI